MDKSKARIQAMFADIASFYDLANSVLSLGLHNFWKKKLVEKVYQSKANLTLDLCCGTGDIHLALTKKELKSVALDFTFPMLKLLSSRQAEINSDKVNALCGDALNLPFRNNTFSCVTVSYGVRNFESLNAGLKEIYRVMQPNSKLFVLESGQAPKGIIGSLIRFYESKIIPLIGRLFFSNANAYTYLSKSSEAFPSREDFISICKHAGFSSGKYSVLFFGASYLYEIEK